MVPHFLQERIEKSMTIAQSLLEVTTPYCKPTFPPHIPLGLPSSVVPKTPPKITFFLTSYHVVLHTHFSSTENVMDYSPKLPSGYLNGANDTLNH